MTNYKVDSVDRKSCMRFDTIIKQMLDELCSSVLNTFTNLRAEVRCEGLVVGYGTCAGLVSTTSKYMQVHRVPLGKTFVERESHICNPLVFQAISMTHFHGTSSSL